MKKVLVIHTNYREYGGEDVAVNNELNLLSRHFEVQKLIYNNSSRITLFDVLSFFLLSNRKSNRELIVKLRNFQPDIVYLHNTWFRASLGVFKILQKYNAKTLVKLHNFRYECTRTYFSKKHLNGQSRCFACGLEQKNIGYFNKYFDNSFIKSYFVTKYGKKYFKILKTYNIKILTLTKFQKNSMIQLGIDETKIEVFPNFINLSKDSSIAKKLSQITYAGRVSREKGIEELIKSFIDAELDIVRLKIIGDGPLLSYLKRTYTSNKIDFLGQIDNESVLKIIQESQAVVTATKLLEGQPTLLCEASSLGIPSIFPRSGGISEFFPKNCKLSFEQFSYEDLTSKLKLLTDEDLVKIEGENNSNYISNYLYEKEMVTRFTQIVKNIDE